MHPEHPLRASRRRGAVRALALTAMLAGASVLTGGCGGSGSRPGVANVTARRAPASRSPHAGRAEGGIDLGGDGSSPSGAGPSQEIEIAGTLTFSRCMRASGVPDFPDPSGQGSIQFNTSKIDPDSPQFERAQQKCAKYMRGGPAASPGQRARTLARALEFSRCMRSHGVPDFPDPPSGAASSKLSGSGPAPPGLDPRSPIFQRALKVCGSLLPVAVGNAPSASG